jgi:ribosomal protein S18 acetylase RimI-like enzyme
MLIRAFESSDQDDVISLWGRCGLLRPWNDPKKDIERKLALQPELFLVGCEATVLVASAMAGYDGHRGAVYYLAVEPGRQKLGLGRALMAEVERRLMQMGCPKINILIRSSNLVVQDFYVSLGYKAEAIACMGKRLIADG